MVVFLQDFEGTTIRKTEQAIAKAMWFTVKKPLRCFKRRQNKQDLLTPGGRRSDLECQSPSSKDSDLSSTDVGSDNPLDVEMGSPVAQEDRLVQTKPHGCTKYFWLVLYYR